MELCDLACTMELCAVCILRHDEDWMVHVLHKISSKIRVT